MEEAAARHVRRRRDIVDGGGLEAALQEQRHLRAGQPLAGRLQLALAQAGAATKDGKTTSPRPCGAAERAVLLARIAAAVKAYPSYATPRAVWWTLDPWTIAAGLLTPTLKNKRPALEHRFAAEIEQIYAKKPAAVTST